MSTQLVDLPPSGQFIQSVRSSSRSLREKSGITISQSSIHRLLFSESFTSTYSRLRLAHGMQLPLKFPSVLSELNVLCILSLLNFASGYRVPLYNAVGRGAFNTIRALVFSMYISSDVEGDYLSAIGMKGVEAGKIAELMGVADKIHQEKEHKSIPGVLVGELGGPIWELVQLITGVLNETGEVLVKGGYPNLGAFVAEALKESEKVKHTPEEGGNPQCDFILERLVRAIPAFRDAAVIDGTRKWTPCLDGVALLTADSAVYCFKKALLTIHAIALRFGSQDPPPFFIPDTTNLPVFSDNVLPSMLVHLGVIDLTTSVPSLQLRDLFPNAEKQETLAKLLSISPQETSKDQGLKTSPKEGPILTIEQAFILRASAIDACELIVDAAKSLPTEVLADREDIGWIKDITLPEIDAWIWAVAKDRTDYRALERFALRATPYF